MNGYRDLVVWQKSMALVTAIYRVTREFPRDEQYGLTSQLRRAAVSIPSNLGEGFGRTSRKDFHRFIGQARGPLNEVETQLEIAMNLDFLTRASATQLMASVNEVGRMLNGLRLWSESEAS